MILDAGSLIGLLTALAGVALAVYRWQVLSAVIRDVWPQRAETERRTERLLQDAGRDGKRGGIGRGGADDPDALAERLHDALRSRPAPPPR